MRERLPDRRMSATEKITHGPHSFFVTIGIDRMGNIKEVFYADGQRSGSDLQHAITDACVIISIALQHGVTPDEMFRSLASVPVVEWADGEPVERHVPASIMGAIVNHIMIRGGMTHD